MAQRFRMSTKFCNFGGFAMRKPPKLLNFWKIGPKWPYFSWKILKNGYLFGQSHPYRWVWVWSLSGTPLSISNLSTPPGISPSVPNKGSALHFLTFPQSQQKLANSSIFLKFCPLWIAPCPSMPSAIFFWCHHCLGSAGSMTEGLESLHRSWSHITFINCMVQITT